MRKAITAILSHSDKIFVITRQNTLTAFPGYSAFPGGTVEVHDDLDLGPFPGLTHDLQGALVRELKEELNFDLANFMRIGQVEALTHLGVAITPSFNPYRFETHFVHVELKSIPSFQLDQHEIARGEWLNASQVLSEYYQCLRICVPPTRRVIEAFASPVRPIHVDFSRGQSEDHDVPYIETIYGVVQFIPLSNTFPPANRTNCFLIGDDKKVLIDPSPKDESELIKLKKTLKKFDIDLIFLTHHHPDHHEFAPDLCRTLNVPVAMSTITHDFILKKWGPDYFANIEVRFVKEGDILTRSIGTDIILYHVPGHDEGQLAPARSDHRWIIVGDLIQAVGTVVIGAPEGDMAKYFNSLKRMINLNPQFIVPSHGITLGGTQKLELTLKHRQQRENQILALLKDGKNQEDILNIVYEGIDTGLIKYARKTIAAHIAKITAEKLI